jgi:hypothetical protein
MALVHLVGPDDTTGKCVMCLAHAKQLQWNAYQGEIKAAHAAGGDRVQWLAWLPALDKEILDGPYRAVPGDAPQLGVVDGLCWDHVAGIGAPAPPSPVIPAGLIPGKR